MCQATEDVLNQYKIYCQNKQQIVSEVMPGYWDFFGGLLALFLVGLLLYAFLIKCGGKDCTKQQHYYKHVIK